MTNDAEFKYLGDMVETAILGANPIEEAQTELLYAILAELRTNREATMRLQEQFDKVTAYGNAMLTERV